MCGGRAGRANAWFLKKGDEGFSKEKVALALGTCEICPVQWDCVTYAIEGECIYGIYGVRREDRKVLGRKPNWKEMVSRAKEGGCPVSSVIVAIGRDPWSGIQSRPMTPTYGATLVVDGEALADDAIIIPCGTKSITAWAWNPEKGENDRIAEMLRPIYEDGPGGTKVTGMSVLDNGEPQTWLISAGRRCRGCH